MSTSNQTNSLEFFRDVAKNLNNEAIKEWKKNGGKVVGYYYANVPEELFTAAGIMPYRIRGTGADSTDLSDAYFSQINCSYVRYNYEMVLENQFDFLDGVVSFNACDHLRRLFENWKERNPELCFHFLVVPQKLGDLQTALYTKELEKLKESIEATYDVAITDEKLTEAVQLHNKTRKLQRKLYELRKKEKPPISGADVLAVMVAGYSMPKKEYNIRLAALLDELRNQTGTEKPKARLMIIGGEIDDPNFIEVLESQGAMVVTDLLWYGTRSCLKDISETGDPLAAISQYYLNERPSDPRTYGTSLQRYEQIKELAKDGEVDGIISARLLLCDIFAYEQDDFARYAKENNLPHLKLEIEYNLTGIGQLKTRVQAFQETLEGK
ncbi:2-hydroxyacyl-CoA dehydratase subunit D [Acetobacterium sp. KB-1]|jgi:bcr-type benzoyl-CoA reductase subunit C|uniref:2-hydroxyacyl-CoA dehydratase subunit D n=1 Tax=Acetobacterium sp. KB-1 TaxID=2184575 RepID=UPI000DBEBDF6|nr:2-hydroxyacyl-CoA dehydratase family protein [Acetobacterium sp. KB-1]AWW25869.1 2-hydroxyacyl-CoA dehydratase [Acetobacterium sp. KB-1]